MTRVGFTRQGIPSQLCVLKDAAVSADSREVGQNSFVSSSISMFWSTTSTHGRLNWPILQPLASLCRAHTEISLSIRYQFLFVPRFRSVSATLTLPSHPTHALPFPLPSLVQAPLEAPRLRFVVSWVFASASLVWEPSPPHLTHHHRTAAICASLLAPCALQACSSQSTVVHSSHAGRGSLFSLILRFLLTRASCSSIGSFCLSLFCADCLTGPLTHLTWLAAAYRVFFFFCTPDLGTSGGPVSAFPPGAT